MTNEIIGVLEKFGIDGPRFEGMVEQLSQQASGRYARLWAYYANPLRVIAYMAGTSSTTRPYRQAQEWGVPARITGYRAGSNPLTDGCAVEDQRKEVVIENDIAWRVDTMVEYLFGKIPLIHSTHPDVAVRTRIDKLLAAIFENAGGTQFLQQYALIGAVYGFVDVAVTLDVDQLENLKRASGLAAAANTGQPSFDAIVSEDRQIENLARLVSLRIVEPARAFAILDPEDIGRLRAYAQVRLAPQRGRETGIIDRIIGAVTGPTGPSRIVELWTADGWWRWQGDDLQATGGNSLGAIPIVHVQNTAMPFAYGGTSDVEPLIPLQDELNTRLSDRAHRIAMQSFKMYLAKNVPDFATNPPKPGRCWIANSPDADIQELGGTAACPSEDAHIAEVREAIDRASSVPPVAAGAIRNRIGNLTSAAALRITLTSLLSRTERKRGLYGEGIERMCAMALGWLDAAGVFSTPPEEREVEIHWPSPLPQNDAEKLAEAKLKLDLGVGKEVVLRELGY